MRSTASIYLSLVLLAGLLALGPVVFCLLTGTYTWSIVVLCLFNLAGWSVGGYLLSVQLDLLDRSESLLLAVGLKGVKGGIFSRVSTCLNEVLRWQEASYAFRKEGEVRDDDLGANLQKIVKFAYEKLPIKAVQLSLHDEVSRKSSQTMMIGEASGFSSQGLGDGEDVDISQLSRGDKGDEIDIEVKFAGTRFGTLRLELYPDSRLSESDSQVAHLLAKQGGLLLADANFGDELIKMRTVSEESIRAKTGFLATLSHELRGPLGIVINGVELITEQLCGPTTTQQNETLGMIKSSGEHLLDLVNDVLDYAKAEAGTEIPKPVDLEIAPFLQDIANVVRTQATRKQHKLMVSPVEAGLGITCDKRHARQIMINFLTNAIKYTPDGGEITIKATATSEDRVIISVTDNGIGIPEEQQAKVFSAFERVDDVYANQQVGTGLGMALTRRLVELNKGRIGFESQENQGSTFYAILPQVSLAEMTEQQLDEPETGKQVAGGNGEKILLVDRDPESTRVWSSYLGEQGYEVVTIAEGTAVLRTLKEQEFSIALVDNDLGEFSCEDIVKLIRSNKGRSLPIVLISSRAFSFDIDHYLRIGVDLCLSKPVSLQKLAETISSLVMQK